MVMWRICQCDGQENKDDECKCASARALEQSSVLLLQAMLKTTSLLQFNVSWRMALLLGEHFECVVLFTIHFCRFSNAECSATWLVMIKPGNSGVQHWDSHIICFFCC